MNVFEVNIAYYKGENRVALQSIDLPFNEINLLIVKVFGL